MTSGARPAGAAPRRIAGLGTTRLTGRQANLWLGILVPFTIASGLTSWLVPLDSARVLTVLHTIAGFTIVLVGPAKVRGPVRAGLRRGRPGRWMSVLFGVTVVTAVVTGGLHSTGAWFGVGIGSALWIHQAAGFAAIVLLGWHLWSRPVRPGRTDLDRRAVLAAGTTLAGGAALSVVQELALESIDGAGATRAGTGSHEIASFRPAGLPRVQWLDDRVPDAARAGDATPWNLTVAGIGVDVADLRARATPLTARLDCTGGWYSDQDWQVVTLATLLDEVAREAGAASVEGRSIAVTSATGYRRRFPLDEAADLHLAVGYGDEALRAGHGAPVRLVAPGRRGPNWVKWVVSVTVDDRPAWLQLPLPPT